MSTPSTGVGVTEPVDVNATAGVGVTEPVGVGSPESTMDGKAVEMAGGGETPSEGEIVLNGMPLERLAADK